MRGSRLRAEKADGLRKRSPAPARRRARPRLDHSGCDVRLAHVPRSEGQGDRAAVEGATRIDSLAAGARLLEGKARVVDLHTLEVNGERDHRREHLDRDRRRTALAAQRQVDHVRRGVSPPRVATADRDPRRGLHRRRVRAHLCRVRLAGDARPPRRHPAQLRSGHPERGRARPDESRDPDRTRPTASRVSSTTSRWPRSVARRARPGLGLEEIGVQARCARRHRASTSSRARTFRTSARSATSPARRADARRDPRGPRRRRYAVRRPAHADPSRAHPDRGVRAAARRDRRLDRAGRDRRWARDPDLPRAVPADAVLARRAATSTC